MMEIISWNLLPNGNVSGKSVTFLIIALISDCWMISEELASYQQVTSLITENR